MQFKSLGEQIEFYLNPNHLDLWKLQESFKTMINRYYRAKLTSRTLFQLQSTINEIERLCEIIRLISNKKATKQCKEGVEKLEALLEKAGQNYQIIREKADEIIKLTDPITKDNIDWLELAYHLQQKLNDDFRSCLSNYEFQKLLKLSNSEWSEAWEFLTSKITVLTTLVGMIIYVGILFINIWLIGELKDKHLDTLLDNIGANYQIELLKALFMPLTICVILPAILLVVLFADSNLILDKTKAKVVKDQNEAKKFIFDKLKKLIFFVVILGSILSAIHANIFKGYDGCLICFIIAIILAAIYIIAKYIFSGVKDFLLNLGAVALILIPISLALFWAAVNNKNPQIVDYILIIELLVIVVLLVMFVEMRVYNSISKAGLFVLIYFATSWVIISQQINILEFLGVKNNPNIVSLLKVKMDESDLTGQLRDMGFYQLNYSESQTSYRQLKKYINESQASDLQLESYVFTQGTKSAIYLSESLVHLSDIKTYVTSNKNTICESKLNRAVLSEFEDDGESWHYFGYKGCNLRINLFESDEKIKLVNKLFWVRKSGNNYTYWIFGAHVNYKKLDDILIISAAKNDNFNTITLNKERGMLYYEEAHWRVDQKYDDLLSYKLTHYDNESNVIY